MKKLVSLWGGSAKNLNIKAYSKGYESNCDINSCIFSLKNNIKLLIPDYFRILSDLDSFYSGESINSDLVSDNDTLVFATIVAKILAINYPNYDISQHPELYFMQYITPVFEGHLYSDLSSLERLAKYSYGFENYVSYLIYRGAKRFDMLGLIRVLEVFLRDEALKKDAELIITLCSRLDHIFLVLADNVVKSSPGVYGFPYSDELEKNKLVQI